MTESAHYSANEYGKVAVLYGGLSAERNISLVSGQAVLDALQRKGINAQGLDVQMDITDKLIAGKFDRVFIALHGRGGEDGQIQGVLETLSLPYSGSGILGSALAMDKASTKKIWQGAGIPTPEFIELHENSDWQAIAQQLGLPLMVKPVHEGSSLGASKVTRADTLKKAWQQAVEFDSHVMAEQWITGKEYTVPILKNRVLPIIRLVVAGEFYDYHAKYEAEDTKYICPSGLAESQEQEIGEIALNAFNVLRASGWGRVDLMMDEKNRPWFIEANTIPGMTSHSLVPMSAKVAGIDFDTLVVNILESSFDKRM